ncbi:hypothetical protein SLEP1_g45293 [Rubroshorea leprosula]|uniref:Uncharacterized protein n=1 Tax=Rubroshorea leprosula TaxID=152421 RepID=A0AAV5LIL9_9ROSI|nr:hypothetical protein SLEP1_g45293 [Rubroshorea leprosula]
MYLQVKDYFQLSTENEEGDKTDVIERGTGAVHMPRGQSAEDTDKDEKSPTMEDLDETPSSHPERAESESLTSETLHAVELGKDILASDAVYEPQDKDTEKNVETRESTIEETEGGLEYQYAKQDDITFDKALPEVKSEEQLQTPSPRLPSQNKEIETTTIEKEKEKQQEDMKTLESRSPEDFSDAKTTEEVCLRSEEQREPKVVLEDDITVCQGVPAEKPEEKIQTPPSLLPSEEQECQKTNMDGKTEQDKIKEATIMLDQTTDDHSDANTGDDVTTTVQTLMAEKSDEQIETTSPVSLTKEQESETAVSIEKTEDKKTADTGILEDESPEDSSETKKTKEICFIQEEPQELEGDQKEENAAAQSLLVEKSKEQIPAPSSTLPSEELGHGTTTKVDEMEEERVNEDKGPIEVEGVAEREVIAGSILPADESEEIQNTKSVEKEAEKLEDESHEDSSMAIVQHELTDGQTISAEKTKQQAQEEEQEAMTIAKIEDDKEGAEIIEDENANSNAMKDLCLKKDSTEPETVEETEITADQTSIEEKSEEQSQSAISALPSNEQKCDDATRVENTEDQVFSAEESEQQVQGKEHEAVITSKMVEDDKKEEATTIDDEGAEDAKDSKTMEDLCQQKEPTEPKAVTEDEIAADQAPVEKKAVEHIQIATSALTSSSKQECEGATEVENTDGKTFSAEKSEQLVQEKEHEMGIIGEKIEGNKIEGAEIVEHENTKDASDSNIMTDLSQQKESTEPEAVIENKITADQTLMEEKSEEQIQNAISALPSEDTEFEGATTVENTDGQIFSAEKSEQQIQEEHEAVIIAKKIEDDKKAGAEITERESAGDASHIKTMEDLCPQKESTESEAVIENETTADQTVLEEKSEEKIQIASSSLPPKEVEFEGATTVEDIKEGKIKETENLEGVDAKRAEDVLLEKGMLQEFEAVVRKEEITSQKKEEEEILEDESAEDAKTMRDLCSQKESTELETALDNKITIDPTVVEEKPEEQVQIATHALPSEEQECKGATIVENIEEEKTKKAEILEQDILLQKERLQVSKAVRQDEIESAQGLPMESTEQQLTTPSHTLPSEEEEHGTATKVNKMEEETMEEEEILEKDSSAGKPEEKGAEDISLAKEKLQELEGVTKNEVAFAQTPMTKLEEQLQAPSTKLVSEEEEEHGTKTGNEKIGEEKLKELEMLEREYSAAKSTEEKRSEKEGPKEFEDVMNEEIIADQTLPAEESQELETKRAVQKVEELKEAEKLEDESCENASYGTKTKEICFPMEEPSKLQHVAKDEIAAVQTFSAEHSEELQISAPALSSEGNEKTIEEDEPKKNGDSSEKITEDKEVVQTMKASDQEDQLKDGFLGAEENNATFKTTAKDIQTEEMSVEIQKVDGNKNVEKIQAEDRSPKDTDNTSSVAMTETKTIREEESGVATSQMESSTEKTANEASDEQIPSEVDMAESSRKPASTGTEIGLLEKLDGVAETFRKGEVRDLEPGNAKEIYPEIKKEFEHGGGEKKSCDPDDSAIQEITTKETPPVTKEMTKQRERTASKKKPQIEEADEGEEGNKRRKMDSDPDSPVMVEAPREKENIRKVPPKKSHNILSGVGSRVKHSISKVKKAFICASPNVVNPKSSEKQDE